MNRKSSAFRHWVQEIWFQNCEERLNSNQPKLTISEYVREHKYWLKAQYRQQP